MDRPRRKPLRYFFYEGDLHKKIHIHRPNDVITSWNYPQKKMDKNVYSDVRRRGEQAFTTKQVAHMVNRTRVTVENCILKGNIHAPQKTYTVDERQNGFAYYWNEKNIFELWEFLCTVHYGKPRKDGLVTPLHLPTARELRAMIRQGTVFYIQVDGEFVPTWQADNL